MLGVDSSDHPLEQDLKNDLTRARTPLEEALVQQPLRRLPSDQPDTPQMVETRRVAATLLKAFPDLATVSPNIQALLNRHAVDSLRSGVPLDRPAELLQHGLPYLQKSWLPGAKEAANLLRPPRTDVAGSGPADMLLASGARARDAQGRPLAVLYPRDSTGLSTLNLFSEQWASQDLGQHVGALDSQCVIVTLAHVGGVKAEDFLQAGVRQATKFLSELGPMGEWLSTEELSGRQSAHDFLFGRSHDFFAVRTFFHGLFEAKRLVIVSVAGTDCPVQVQVLQSPTWNGRAPGAGTFFLLAARGHAEILRIPTRYGNYAPGEAVPFAAAQAVLGHLGQYVEVEYYNTVTMHDLKNVVPKTIPRSALSACSCGCGEPLQLGPSIRAGKLALNPKFPYPLRDYAEKMAINGGLTKENVEKVYSGRGGDHQEWRMTTQEVKDHPFPKRVVEAADAYLAVARDAESRLNKEALKVHQPKAMRKLAGVLRKQAMLGDELVRFTDGSVRAAAAALRQAQIRHKGTLPLDSGRLEELRGLVGDAELDVLKGMADWGVPVLQISDHETGKMEGPYDSAEQSAGSLGCTAVKDAANGRSLLLSRASEQALRDAHATLSRLGAVPKKDALGKLTGEMRPVTDLRPLNSRIAEEVLEQWLKVALEAPPAVCPKMKQLIRHAVHLSLLFPGVPIMGGKSDLAEAFKLVHLMIADTPSMAWALPTKNLPGLEDAFLVQVAFMLPFGFDKSPGWFGMLAWPLAEAYSCCGPDLETLNAALAYFGLPHVDDTVYLTMDVGQRKEMAYEAFLRMARVAAGEDAINVAKDAIDGVATSILRPWGKLLDLSGIVKGGPLAGKLISPPEKVAKLAALLEKFDELHLRRLSIRTLREAVGLAVWLSDTNPLLKALLPSFYAALSSQDAVHVDPPGSAQQVTLVWTELNEAVALAKLQCEDATKFAASFTSSLVQVLTPPEQVAVGVQRAWLQSDATGRDLVLAADGTPALDANGQRQYKEGIFAVVCFYLGVYAVDLVARYEELLCRIIALDRLTHIIVGEMLPLIAAAMEHGEQWRNMLITCAVDNVAVVAAINKSASSHPFVRYLCLLLVRLQSLHGFTMHAYYINTKRNVLADQLTRLDLSNEEQQAYVDSHYTGLKRVTYTKLYEFLLDEEHATAQSYALTLDGEDGIECLLKKANARRGWWRAAQWQAAAGDGSAAAPPEHRLKAKVIEVYGGAGNGAVAAARAGLEVAALVEWDETSRRFAAERLKALEERAQVTSMPRWYETVSGATTDMSATLGVELVLVAAPPPGEDAASEVSALVARVRPKMVCVELLPARLAHKQAEEVEVWATAFGKVGMKLLGPATGVAADEGEAWERVDVAELGGGQRRERVVLHFEETCWANVAGPLVELRPQPGPGLTLATALQPVEELKEELFVQGNFVPVTRQAAPTQPRLAGYLYEQGGAAEVAVGSVVQLRGDGAEERWVVRYVEEAMVLRVSKIPAEGGVDLIGDEVTVNRSEVVEHLERRREVWNVAGVSATVCSAKAEPLLILEERGAVERVRRLGMGEKWKLQGLSLDDLYLYRRMARRSVARARREQQESNVASRTQHSVLSAAVVTRAASRLEVLTHRLRLWDSEGRYLVVERLGTGETEVIRCEDGTVVEVDKSRLKPYDRCQIGALVKGEDEYAPTTRVAGGPSRPLERPAVGPGVGAREKLLKATMTRLVGGSVKDSTKSSYDSAFRSWVLFRVAQGKSIWLDGKNPREDEDELLVFIAHMALNAGYAHSTIHVALHAVRFKHLLNRHPNPLEEAPLVRVAMKGVQRLQGGPLRKVPATMSMLRWIVQQLNLDDNDELLVAIALVTMFIFLLRSREALRKGKVPDAKQCICVKNVVLVGAKVVRTGNGIQDADEVVLMQGASKTDPNGQGSVANVFETPGDELCLVGLIKRLQRQKPDHFKDPDAFFLTLSDGRVLHRDVVSDLLQGAAVAFGAPKEATSVISLRSGGASAMWDKGFTAEEIKRRGRWASDCYRVYVWEGHDKAKDVAARMMSSELSIMASLAAYRRKLE